MSYRRVVKTQAKSESGDIQEFLIEFDIHESNYLDEGRKTSYFPIFVKINGEDISVNGDMFTNPLDNQKYKILIY